MDRTEIAKTASQMKSKEDLLSLLNRIKQAELEEIGLQDQFHPFTMKHINYYCNPNNAFHRYTQFKVKKKSGGFRLITSPRNRSFMVMLSALNELLKSLYTPSDYAMGFAEGRSVVSNANIHKGQNYVFNIDLKDFFPSIEQPRVWKRLQLTPFNFPEKIASLIAGMCSMKETRAYEDGRQETFFVLPQGAPTSPIITNMICDTLDRRLAGLAKRFGLNYTRYADDITFSSMHNVYQEDSAFRKELERIITEQGFTINPKKTRLNIIGARQEVTGLTVNNKVNVSRRFIEDLRGLLYIWEKYGYAASKPRVVEGKIAFLKMVKGASDPTYLKLQERYNKLMHRCHKNQPLHTDVLYRETMTVAAFEQKFHTTLSLVGDPARLARFEVDDKDTWVLIKHTADMTLPKEQLCISYCELKDRSDHFWLIHEPYISHLFKKPD